MRKITDITLMPNGNMWIRLHNQLIYIIKNGRNTILKSIPTFSYNVRFGNYIAIQHILHLYLQDNRIISDDLLQLTKYRGVGNMCNMVFRYNYTKWVNMPETKRLLKLNNITAEGYIHKIIHYSINRNNSILKLPSMCFVQQKLISY